MRCCFISVGQYSKAQAIHLVGGPVCARRCCTKEAVRASNERFFDRLQDATDTLRKDVLYTAATTQI